MTAVDLSNKYNQNKTGLSLINCRFILHVIQIKDAAVECISTDVWCLMTINLHKRCTRWKIKDKQTKNSTEYIYVAKQDCLKKRWKHSQRLREALVKTLKKRAHLAWHLSICGACRVSPFPRTGGMFAVNQCQPRTDVVPVGEVLLTLVNTLCSQIHAWTLTLITARQAKLKCFSSSF